MSKDPIQDAVESPGPVTGTCYTTSNWSLPSPELTCHLPLVSGQILDHLKWTYVMWVGLMARDQAGMDW